MVWKPDYVTAAQLITYLRVNAAEDIESVSTFAALWVTAVSRNIDDHCGRQFGKVAAPEARTYDASRYDRDLCRYVYEIDDLATAAGLVVADADAVAVTGSATWPRRASFDGKPITQLRSLDRGPLTLTSDQWGWAAVPPSIPTALYLQAARLAARRDSPFGISGSPQEQGEIRLLAQLDPDFRTTLKPYVRTWWAA